MSFFLASVRLLRHFGCLVICCLTLVCWSTLCAVALGQTSKPADEVSNVPDIRLWYGDSQSFGHLGNSQPTVHILGNVTAVKRVADTYFQVNRGQKRPFSLGTDLHRLGRDGDFNIEISRDALRNGPNDLNIVVRTAWGDEVKKNVVIHYDSKPAASLPMEVDFSKVNDIQTVAEVIDGKWELTEQGVRTEQPYYDRVLAFGDRSWTDYEATAEIIFHPHLPELKKRSLGGPPYLSHSHTSFNLRWAGYPEDGFQPRRDWRSIGALVALRVDRSSPKQGSYWWLHFGRGIQGVPAKRSLTDKVNRSVIELEQRYCYRMRVKTLSDQTARYSTKVWNSTSPEPAQWQFEATDESEAFRSGCLAFVVHHSDVTLCRLRIDALDSE